MDLACLWLESKLYRLTCATQLISVCTHVKMDSASNECPWRSAEIHVKNNKSCSLETNCRGKSSANAIRVHVDDDVEIWHKYYDVQYSTNVENGAPIYIDLFKFNNDDNVLKAYDFGLNHRGCTVETLITGSAGTVNDLDFQDRVYGHIANIRVANGNSMWTIIYTLLKFADRVNLVKQVWPTDVQDSAVIFKKSQYGEMNLNDYDADGYIPIDEMITGNDNDGGNVANGDDDDEIMTPLGGDDYGMKNQLMVESNLKIIQLRPVRYSWNSKKLTFGISDLIHSLFQNYVDRSIESFIMGNENPGKRVRLTDATVKSYGANVKVRRIACNYNVLATRYLLSRNGDDSCSTADNGDDKKQNMVCNTNGQQQNSRKRAAVCGKDFEPPSQGCWLKSIYDRCYSKYSRKVFDIYSIRRIFHSATIDVFGDNIHHSHMILCKDYMFDDEQHRSEWLTFIQTFASNRISSNDTVRNKLRVLTKQWKIKHKLV